MFGWHSTEWLIRKTINRLAGELGKESHASLPKWEEMHEMHAALLALRNLKRFRERPATRR